MSLPTRHPRSFSSSAECPTLNLQGIWRHAAPRTAVACGCVTICPPWQRLTIAIGILKPPPLFVIKASVVSQKYLQIYVCQHSQPFNLDIFWVSGKISRVFTFLRVLYLYYS